MRALGLDVGARRIGVAVTDEAEVAAHPVTVIDRAGTAPDVRAILALRDQYEATFVVIGMPYELDGREGLRAKRVRVLGDALAAALPAGVTIVWQDERFTTAEVQRVLLAADVSRARRKEVVDKQAAAVILRGWLDARQRRG